MPYRLFNEFAVFYFVIDLRLDGFLYDGQSNTK